MSAGRRMKKLLFPILLASSALFPASAQMSVNLTPSIPSPAPLGTVVKWSAAVANASSGTLEYRFQARYSGRGYRVTMIPVGNPSNRTATNAGMTGPAIGDFHTVVDFG